MPHDDEHNDGAAQTDSWRCPDSNQRHNGRHAYLFGTSVGDVSPRWLERRPCIATAHKMIFCNSAAKQRQPMALSAHAAGLQPASSLRTAELYALQ